VTGTSRPARRITPPDWLRDPGIRRLLEALGTARFVGGAVRDTVLGRPIGDLDLATPLPPGEVVAKLTAAGIRSVPTGIAHGTVTAILAHRPIEITTLRRDVETDGRHAVVAFTTDWAADAARRDFTLNALYLDAEGGIWDPVGGLPDLEAGLVRFVGDPATRLAEDVLRLLRFYRFQALYGRQRPDPVARAACAAQADRLDTLAGERVQAEFLRLLEAADPVPVLHAMIADGVLGRLLPPPANLGRLARLLALEPIGDPLRRLAALLPDGMAPAVADRLKLSNADRDRLAALTGGAEKPDLLADDRTQRRVLRRLGPALYRDLVLLAAAGTSRPMPVRHLLDLADAWRPKTLPIGGSDALALGLEPGPAIGNLLAAVEAWWIDGDFSADRTACLEHLRTLVAGVKT
jgi:poly(A) polymerase